MSHDCRPTTNVSPGWSTGTAQIMQAFHTKAIARIAEGNPQTGDDATLTAKPTASADVKAARSSGHFTRSRKRSRLWPSEAATCPSRGSKPV